TRAVDADADGDRVHVALPFDQDAGEFGTREQEIVRPFDRQPWLEIGGDIHHGIVDRKRRNERKLRPTLGCRRPRKQQAGVEIAGRRYPRAPAPAAARALSLGGDPERPPLALACKTEALGLGRPEPPGREGPPPRRGRPGLEFHSASSFIQNSDFAAALAASTSGLG